MHALIVFMVSETGRLKGAPVAHRWNGLHLGVLGDQILSPWPWGSHGPTMGIPTIDHGYHPSLVGQWFLSFFIHTHLGEMYQDLGQDHLRYLLPEFRAQLHLNPRTSGHDSFTPLPHPLNIARISWTDADVTTHWIHMEIKPMWIWICLTFHF